MEVALAVDRFRRRRRRFAIAALIVLGFWMLLGPGRKYDEWAGIMLFQLILSGIAIAASFAAPSRIFNALFYPLVFGIGYVLTNLRVELAYGYETFRRFWVIDGARTLAVGFGVLLVVNLLMWWWWRRRPSPPGRVDLARNRPS